MKIAMVAPFEESVPPKKYGGTEVVIYNLITELVSRGHDVTLLGTGDSDVPCKLVPIVPKALRHFPPFDTDQAARETMKFIGCASVLSHLQTIGADIVHNHYGWRILAFSPLLARPMVTTFHGPLSGGYFPVLFSQDACKNQAVVSISNNQRIPMPYLNYIDTIYNGIDIDKYAYSDKHEDFLLFLARFSPDKGAKEAIQIAKKTGRKLYVAVKEVDYRVNTQDREYFESCKPMIDGEQIVLLGELDFSTKLDYLQRAYALLAPIQWEEPFGLYAVEAMACGTPVVGVARGSFPEIIQHGVTGFLGQTVDELAAYVDQISHIDRALCRGWVKDHFTKSAMADGYLRVYEKVLSQQS